MGAIPATSQQSSNSRGTGKKIQVQVQKFGSFLSGMIMPNIGAFIAWGVLTALFIPDGFFPNGSIEELLVGPTLKYLLPLLIGYTGGQMVGEQRGGVVGAVATMGVIAGADIPVFIGAMIMGPLGGLIVKYFDKYFQHRIKAGFEMLVNNFSVGLIGFLLALLGFFTVGPLVTWLMDILGKGVGWIVENNLLPIANVLIEPAKVLFLNNAINHGVLTPLGTTQAAEAGKSILFLLEANPGPGLGVLLAYTFFGRGLAKGSAPGAILIHFLGGIHEIYFPYIMMKPLLFLAVICGGVSGTLTFQLLGAGLVAPASPGSIIAIMGMTAQGSHLAVLAGIAVATAVSFLVAMPILKFDRSETDDSDDFEAKKAAVQKAKAESKGQNIDGASTATSSEDSGIDQPIDKNMVDKIIFACDAGMGSSAMGASVLRDKAKKAGLSVPVTNSAIAKLDDDEKALIVTQVELSERARKQAPNASIVTVDNFMNSPVYDQVISDLQSNDSSQEGEEISTPVKDSHKDSGSQKDSDSPQTDQSKKDRSEMTAVNSGPTSSIQGKTQPSRIKFAHGAHVGASPLGAAAFKEKLNKLGVDIPIEFGAFDLADNLEDTVIIVSKAHPEAVQAYQKLYDAKNLKSTVITVESLTTNSALDQLVEDLKAQ